MTERERLIDNLDMADSLGIKIKLSHRKIKVALAAMKGLPDLPASQDHVEIEKIDQLIMEGDPTAGDTPRGVIRGAA
jgi:hypothetical protein